MAGVTVFLVGSGAVENAWKPVLGALHEFDEFRSIRSPEAANLAFARLVYMARFPWMAIAALEAGVYGLDEKEVEVRRTQYQKGKRKVASLLQDVTRRIAARLIAAEKHGRIKPRAPFLPVLRRFAGEPDRQYVVVTTNWDRCLHAVYPVHHLHGDTGNPGSLYLPTEVAEEPYRKPASSAQLASIRNGVARIIGQADRSVLYGLALSALDAELCQVVASGILGRKGQPPREIDFFVVDPAYQVVGERLATFNFVGGPSMPVWGLEPRRLSVRRRMIRRSGNVAWLRPERW